MHSNAAAVPAAAVASDVRRLSINMSARAAEALNRLSVVTGQTKTNVVKFALGFLRLVLEEHQKGNRIAVLDRDGKPVRELVLPWWD